MESLQSKVIRSSLWNLGGNWLSRGLGIVKIIILARLLSPLDFGILGLAILSINSLNVFSETGIEVALIQRQKVRKIEFDTAWTIKIIRGCVLFVLLFLCSGWFASYFNNSVLAPVLKIMAISFLLEGITNIGIVFFQKELEFKKKVFLELTADVAGFITAIIMAFLFRNVWALVLGSIVWGFVKCLGSYRVHPFRPRIRWDWPVTKDLLHFGKHIFWITLCTFIITSGDDVIIGKLLGLTTLGFYTMAYNIANIPVHSLSSIIGNVSLPAYSLIQEEPRRLRDAFSKIIETVMIILLPLIGFIFLLAQDFTVVCLGEKWFPIVPALRILCFFGLFRGLVNIFAALHLAVNRPNIQSRNKTIELIVFLVLIYPLTLKWGLIGVSWCVTIVYGLSALINAFDTSRLLRHFWIIMARASVFPAMVLVILIITILGIRSLFPIEIDLWRFLSSALLGMMVYGGTILLFKKQLIKDILKSSMNK